MMGFPMVMSIEAMIEITHVKKTIARAWFTVLIHDFFFLK